MFPQLLAVATGARDLLLKLHSSTGVDACRLIRERVLEKFYPLLADSIAEAQLRDSDDEGDALAPADPKLVALIHEDVVVRKVALAFIIQRLMDGDIASSKSMLPAVVAALAEPRGGSESMADEAAFAVTLSRLLAGMCTSGALLPASDLWSLVVDGFLLMSTSISRDVHEEVCARSSSIQSCESDI